MKTFYLNSWNYILLLVVLSSPFGCSEDDEPLTPPTASFASTTNTAIAGEMVTFNDTSIPGSGVITSWNWTFEGATPNSSTEQNPTVIFNSKGDFSVALTVTTDDSLTGNASQDILAVEACDVYNCEKFMVEESLNIIYGINSNAHLMNIYTPRGDVRANKPALLLNGGGQYEGSDLSLLEPLAKRLASYGFVVATARYRNGIQDGTGNLMRGMVDSRAAVRFLRANASDYDINPNQIFAGGWASGAYNALTHAYWQFEDINPPELYDLVQQWITGWEGVQGNMDVSSEVNGVVNLGGAIFGTQEEYQEDLWITSSDVPMFAVHGTADDETPYGALELEFSNWEFGSYIIHQRLLDVGLQSTLYTIEGGVHESPRLSENIDNYIEELVGFLSGE